MRRIALFCVVVGLLLVGIWMHWESPVSRFAVKRFIMSSGNPGDRSYWRGLFTRHPRSYLPLHLTGNQDTDYILMEYAKIRLSELRSANDTIHGIQFVWTDSLTYGEFIHVLDVPEIEHMPIYMVFGDSLWITRVYRVPDTPHPPMLNL